MPCTKKKIGYDKREITAEKVIPLLDQLKEICDEHDMTYIAIVPNWRDERGPGYAGSYRFERVEEGEALKFPVVKLLGLSLQNAEVHNLLENLMDAIENEAFKELAAALMDVIAKMLSGGKGEKKRTQ